MEAVYWTNKTLNENGKYKAVAGNETTVMENGGSTAVEVTSEDSNFDWSEWYDYVAGDNETDTKTSRWANAKSTADGSYFVWIPRYEYKILNNEHTSTAGKIDVQFINVTTTTEDREGYKIHPAFTTNLELGGWDKEIPGIWVAKYEMSMEETSDNGKTWTNIETTLDTNNSEEHQSIGNKLIGDTVRAVSKPSQYSWSYIILSNCFDNSLNYSTVENTGANSHLMKNSEWGAIAYLTQSEYGRNQNEIEINSYCKNTTNFAKLTGVGGNDENSKYNTVNGMNASTTGNLYGIYDLSGGNWESTAVLYSKNTNLYGTSLYSHTVNKKYTKDDEASQLTSNSSKYVTIYPIKTEGVTGDDGSIDIHYPIWNNIYGDAIYETSSKCGTDTSWYGDRADEDSGGTDGPFCLRGGSYGYGFLTGVFAFADGSGYAGNELRLPRGFSM